MTKKKIEFLYKFGFAAIFIDGIGCYKIITNKDGLFLTDFGGDVLAKVERSYWFLRRKNIIKVYFFNNDKLVTVDKNFFDTEYYVNLNSIEKFTIFSTRYKGLISRGEKIKFVRLDKKSEFVCKAEYFYDDSLEGQILFIVLFYVLLPRDL